jgi:hypothetical protein
MALILPWPGATLLLAKRYTFNLAKTGRSFSRAHKGFLSIISLFIIELI